MMAEQIGTQFRWNQARTDAALLLAEDELTDTAIAEKVGIGRTTLFTWKQHPDFQARIAERAAELDASVLQFAIAKKRNRMRRYDDRWTQLESVRVARAEEHKDIPGGDTGLLVRQVKQIGQGRDAQVVEEYAVDVASMREERALAEQAAKDSGQWVDKREDKLDATDDFFAALRAFGKAAGP